jgi:murein DD-endopeptidase MepM/ murein hydrolase activator NlpD
LSGSAARIITICSLFFVIVSFLFYPLVAGAAKGRTGILQPENGMGMSYYESSIIENSVLDGSAEQETLIAGLPEPLEYSKPRMLIYSAYAVERGDTIGEIAMKFGLQQDTLLSLNQIKNSRLLQIGQVLKIPNQDGVLYTVKKGDSLSAIATRFDVQTAAIQTVNELFSGSVKANSALFIPGGRLPQADLQEINGDLFVWPTRGTITSPYGYRLNPFGGARQFHSGIDIGAVTGTPIRAAMAGRVSFVGYNDTSGFHVVISHHSGYRTLYAHMSVIRVNSGAYVRTGDRIGDVGSTGLSTGPHLHFTVYKNGVTVNPRSLIN